MPLKIHLIFKTHLDVGFTDTAAKVVDQYFSHYIPRAIRVARQMREGNRPDRFIWTTGSWLIYEYLERADGQQRREMESAIAAGDIAWHALPFTTHSELMDVDLFRYGLSLSQRLDARFGRRTIAAKLTDVPGHTRGIVPLMAEAGVEFLHVGVNGGSTMPEVPPLFRWQDPTGCELLVMYESSYGSTFIVPGNDEGLAFGHSMDNQGPQSADEIEIIFSQLRAAHPGAEVFASTLNEFAGRLLPIRSSLPIFTQEIGDSWIHGVGSDPIKVSRFLELLRLRKEWRGSSVQAAMESEVDAFQRRLLLVPEHTWGMDEKTWLADDEAYTPAALAAARRKPNFQNFEASWFEQRAYIDQAVAALGESALAEKAKSRLFSIQPRIPDFSGWQRLNGDLNEFSLDGFTGRFDTQTGALVSLIAGGNQWDWADPTHPLGLLRYQTFSAEDYERFFHQYIRPEEQNNDWSREDFTKPGLEKARPVSRFWLPQVMAGCRRENTVSFHLAGDRDAVENYGCPRDFYLQYTFQPDSYRVVVDLMWFAKPACRMPEALWLTFNPVTTAAVEWTMQKLGQAVSPLDVVENGNRHLHAVEALCLQEPGRKLTLTPLDSPLAAPGAPSLLDFNNRQPDLSRGFSFNLYNNVWGTNFPMWLEEDCRFRFILDFSADEKTDGVKSTIYQ